MSTECRRRRLNGGALFLALFLPLTGGPAFSSAGFHAALGDYVPPLVKSVDPERPWPLFVAAELAVTASGDVAEDLFDFAAARTIQHELQRPREPMEGDCIRWGEAYDFGVTTPILDSIRDLVAHSGPIVRGRVTGARSGFSSAVPGQLLRIEVIEQLKGTETSSYGYVFFPVGRLELEEVAICKTDSRYANVPEVGSEVLIFAQGLRDKAAEPLFRLPDNGTGVVVLAQTHDEGELPRVLRTELPGKSGKDVLSKARTLLVESDKHAPGSEEGQGK